MTSDTDTTSATDMSENLGHGQTSDTRVRSSLVLRASDVQIYLGLIHLNLRVMKYLWIYSENLTAQGLKSTRKTYSSI